MSLLSDIDPTAAARVATPPPAASNVARRPAPGNGASGTAPPAKRKAENSPEGVQSKLQRKESSTDGIRTNGTPQSAAATIVANTKPATPANSVPYRGTAAATGSAAAKSAATVGQKLKTAPPPSKINTAVKSAPPAAKSPATASATAPSSGKKMGSYAAMLAKAKEAAATKAFVPTVKHEPTKILTKKERLALAAEAKLGPKTKGAGTTSLAKAGNVKGKEAPKEKREPAKIGYQGTARPKQPADVGYKGTARPTSAGSGVRSASTPGGSRGKAKIDRGKYGGYAPWSDLEDQDEEEDYESDASSDMEGGLWDVEEEEKRALEVAKKEDAAALAEENELKRQKEERRRKLAALAAAKTKTNKRY